MRTRRSKSFYICEAVLRHCQDLEDIYFAGRSLNRIRSGEASTIPLEEVVKRAAVEE